MNYLFKYDAVHNRAHIRFNPSRGSVIAINLDCGPGTAEILKGLVDEANRYWDSMQAYKNAEIPINKAEEQK